MRTIDIRLPRLDLIPTFPQAMRQRYYRVKLNGAQAHQVNHRTGDSLDVQLTGVKTGDVITVEQKWKTSLDSVYTYVVGEKYCKLVVGKNTRRILVDKLVEKRTIFSNKEDRVISEEIFETLNTYQSYHFNR